MRNSFFLGAELEERKITWVSWKTVMAEKQFGGLGVSSLFALNRALLFKWIWRFLNHQTGLWQSIIKAIYGPYGSLDAPIPRRSGGSVWVMIRKSIDALKSKGIDLMQFCNKKKTERRFGREPVERDVSDFTGSKHGFVFRPFKSIVELKKEEDGQFDVIGRVIACEDLDNYDKNGRAGKKKPLTLIDAEGTELRCTLWGVYAQQFSDFLNKCSDHGKIIVVVQLAMTKIWDAVNHGLNFTVSSYTAKMCIQNGFHGTKLFLFNGNKTSDTAEFPEVEAFRQSLVAVEGPAESEQTASRISIASKNSTKDDFVTKFPLKNIAELLDVEQGVPSIIVGTICAIQDEEGWWYLGCRSCRKKVVKSSNIVDLESDTKQTPTAGANEWWYSKCLSTVTSIKTQ
ncbi:nucleic acid-binding, OB-fold protein [Artemisia annua]|uniref:Nucleic acid-binding, OB-fold protein n=1 Tax=Artemisia annua TaxID=35608 RepID=A0A2U1PES2_ARTAN|nr:nucleic acid-binding, OB-fold protein [Artemisia annua]